MIETSDRIELFGTATGGDMDLRAYPLLAYAPRQWGPGVRVASNGEDVTELAVKAQVLGIVSMLERHAADSNVTLAELFDAIRYGRDQGVI